MPKIVKLTHPDFPDRIVIVPEGMAKVREASGWKRTTKAKTNTESTSPSKPASKE